MPRARYHHGDLRNALLDAARRLVERHGPDGFTMAQAAREAGVSSGAPYKHFASRTALLQALAEQAEEALGARIAAATADVDDPMEQFRQTGIALAVFAAEEPGWFRVMQTPEFATFREDDPDVVAFWAPFGELVRSIPPEASLPPDHPLVGQFAARVLVQGLASLLVQDTLRPIGVDGARARQLADAITRFLRLP
jgi:AcrR family transcriptional regulator